MTEHDVTGYQLVTERGWLPGLRADARYRRESLHLRLSGELFAADLAYDGQTQGGAPFRTDTGTGQTRFGAEIGYAVDANLTAVGGLEWDYWKRRIEGHSGVLGIDERYSSWRALGGVHYRIPAAAAGSWSLRALAVAAAPEKMHVRFDNRIFDPVRLSTKAAVGARFGLSFVPSAAPSLELGVELDWIRIPRSDGVALRQAGTRVGTVLQPEHVRRAVELQINYRF